MKHRRNIFAPALVLTMRHFDPIAVQAINEATGRGETLYLPGKMKRIRSSEAVVEPTQRRVAHCPYPAASKRPADSRSVTRIDLTLSGFPHGKLEG